MSEEPVLPARHSSQRSPWRSRARRRAIRRSAQSATAATTCTIAATTFATWRAHCEYEEVAHLLVHGKLPNAAELAAYKARLRDAARFARRGEAGAGAAAGRRRIPWTCCAPASRCWAACCRRRESTAMPARGRLRTRCWRRCRRCCSTGITTRATAGASRWSTGEDSIAAHFLHLLHGEAPSAEWVRAMQTSLILYAEHEFNASTFTARVDCGDRFGSVLVHCRRHWRAEGTQAWRRQRGGAGDSAAVPNARRGRGGYSPARGRARGDHRLRASGLHHRRSAQRNCEGGRAEVGRRGGRHAPVRGGRAH